MLQDFSVVGDNISYKEKKLLDYVLSKYELAVNNIYKQKDIYKIECDHRSVCLKKLKQGKNTILNRNYILENLHNAGLENISKIQKTTEGSVFVKTHKYNFYVTDFIEGEECDFASLSEAIEYGKLLARIHSLLNNIDVRRLKIKSKLEDLPREFYDKLLNLEKFKQIIQKKIIKNEFDLMYLNYIDNFYNLGTLALNVLYSSNFYKIAKESSIKRTLSVGDIYNYIRKCNGTDYFVLEINNLSIDLQIMDLGKFLTKLMYKEDYQWNFDKAKHIIEGYSAINPLNREDLELILATITFPHKFWKLGKRRYLKHKGWSEPKYISKIDKIINNYSLQQKFFTDFLNFINSQTA